MTDRLRASIEALVIDPPGARVTFVDRLARENGWSPDHAAEVDREYRRFLYLAATADEAMTPSDAVDQAWHLHLAYTRSYWDDLCASVLERPLHHGPTQGGPDQAAHWRTRYAATLARYEAIFGHRPPPTIWPSVEDRFAFSFVRVDRRRAWVVPHRGAALAMLPVGGALSVAATGDASILAPLITLAVLTLMAWGFWQQRRGGKRREGDGCGPGFDGDSGDGSDGVAAAGAAAATGRRSPLPRERERVERSVRSGCGALRRRCGARRGSW